MDELRRDAARNRAQIIAAAQSFAVNGEPLALNAVARAANVGVGTVYRHFSTVEELEETLVWERFDDLDELLRDNSAGQLERVLRAHFTLLANDALFEKVIARSEPALEQTAEKRNGLIGQLQELMDLAKTRGQLRPEVDAQVILLLLCGLAHTLRIAQMTPDSAQAQTLLRVLLDGIRTH